MKTTTVITTDGHKDVPVFFHDGITGLCVTMCQFGRFEITHQKTGRFILSGYERASSAVAAMLKLHIAMKEAGIELNAEMHAIQKQVKEASNINHEVLSGMSIIESITIHKQLFNISGEFPWESFDESPFGEIERLKKLI